MSSHSPDAAIALPKRALSPVIELAAIVAAWDQVVPCFVKTCTICGPAPTNRRVPSSASAVPNGSRTAALGARNVATCRQAAPVFR
jgi:hypothetical protein